MQFHRNPLVTSSGSWPPALRPHCGLSNSKVLECAHVAAREGASHRGAYYGQQKILNEFLLFSCLAAVVTGIVIAAASVLI